MPPPFLVAARRQQQVVSKHRSVPAQKPVAGHTVAGVIGQRSDGPGVVALTARGELTLNGKLHREAPIETARLIETGRSPFAHASDQQRETLLTSLTKTLQKKGERKITETALYDRSAAATLLLSLARTSEGPVRQRALDTYALAMSREPHVQLRRSMWVNLHATQLELSGPSTASASKVKEQLLPSSATYNEWFKGQKKPKLEVRHYVMEDFWKQDLAAYAKRGFKVTKQGAHFAELRGVLKDPTGKNPDTVAHVVLRKTNEDVLRDIDDPDVHMIIYSGHAQLGAVLDASVARAAKKKMAGTKLIQLYNCRAGQSQQDILSRWENVHLTTTVKSSYGEDDAQVLTQTYNMIGRRGEYDEIKKNLDSSKLIQGEKNYMLPNDLRNLLMRDSDLDGLKDLSALGPDWFWDPARRFASKGAHVFTPVTQKIDTQTLSGAKLDHGVGFLNSSIHYFTEENRAAPLTHKAASDRFISGRWITGDELVRITPIKREDKTWYRVDVNAALATRSREVITSTILMETQKYFSLKTPAGFDEKAKLRGAMLVGEYLDLFVDTSTTIDKILAGFVGRYGIKGFNYDVYFDASRSMGHDNGTKALAALKKAGVKA
ncbi:MAG: hypothetical protein K1X64_04635 [Myxococcaceae bacterium]|nr:hypothetical protein [Myxococcaceae bacterium]